MAAIVALAFLTGAVGGLYEPDPVRAGVGPPPNTTTVTIGGQVYRYYDPGPAHAGQTADCGGSDQLCGGHPGFYTDSATHPRSFSSAKGSWSDDYTSTPPWTLTCTWRSSGWWDPSGPAWQHGCW